MANVVTVTGHGSNETTAVIVIEGQCTDTHKFKKDADAIFGILRERLPIATLDHLLIQLLKIAVVSDTAADNRDDLVDYITRQNTAIMKGK